MRLAYRDITQNVQVLPFGYFYVGLAIASFSLIVTLFGVVTSRNQKTL